MYNIKNYKGEQYFRILKRAIEAWCMMMVIIMDKGIISTEQLSTRKNAYLIYRTTLSKLSASITLDGIIPIVLFIIFFVFYWKVAEIPFRKTVWVHILAAVFAVFVVVGYSFAMTQSLDLIFADYAQITKAAVCLIGYYGLFLPCIKLCYLVMSRKKIFVRAETAPSRWTALLMDEHPFLGAFAVLALAWLPYLIAYYPGIFMGDTGAQISQYFQLPNGTSNYLNLISDTQLINNHHPVLHTVLMGTAVKIGRMLGSDNLGIFLYTLFQYLCMAAALAYGISYLKNLKMPRWFQGGILGLTALYPVFPRYAVLLSKDTLFSSCVLVFEIFLIRLVREEIKISKKEGILFLLTMLGVMMLRQNGLYVVVFSLPVLLLEKDRRKRRKTALLFCGAIVLYLSYTHILFPALDITPGSRREMLSVPFQQTARYVRDYADEVTEEERDAIDRVLDYDTIGEVYDPNISDPVKKTFHEDADSEDLKAYFKVWFQMFLKHPVCYIKATLNNYYGYFYMGNDDTDRRTRYYESFSTKCMEERIDNKGFDFHHVDAFKGARKFLEMVSELVLHSPMLTIIQASAFYTWLILLGTGYLLMLKRYRYIVILLPAFSILLVSFVSPVNGTIYFRYMLALMFVTPVLAGAVIKGADEGNKNTAEAGAAEIE